MNKEKLEFFIIRQNVKINRKRTAIALTALLLYPIIVLVFDPKPNSVLNISAVLAFILCLVLFAVYRKKSNPFLKVGLLTFSNDIIAVCDKSYGIFDIDKIIISYGGYSGEEYDLAPVGIDFIGSKEGGENYLTVFLKDGEKSTCRFLCTKESDFQNLSKLIQLYKKSGINAIIVKKNE